MKKAYALFMVTCLVVILMVGFFNLPEIDKELSNYYIETAVEDTGAINLITAILFDYRGFDTLGETTVIFAAAASIAFLAPKKKASMLAAEFTMVVKDIINFIIPLLFILGVYFIFYGHLSPGGGFTGGVILANISILLTITFGIDYAEEELPPMIKSLLESACASAIVLFGILGIILGSNFLASGQLGFGSGSPGELGSATLIPSLNLMIGIKVGAGLAIIFNSMIKED